MPGIEWQSAVQVKTAAHTEATHALTNNDLDPLETKISHGVHHRQMHTLKSSCRGGSACTKARGMLNDAL